MKKKETNERVNSIIISPFDSCIDFSTVFNLLLMNPFSFIGGLISLAVMVF
jgi:hypothetical protein